MKFSICLLEKSLNCYNLIRCTYLICISVHLHGAGDDRDKCQFCFGHVCPLGYLKSKERIHMKFSQICVSGQGTIDNIFRDDLDFSVFIMFFGVAYFILM